MGVALGLVLPMWERPPGGPAASWAEIRAMACRAEELGADTVWLADEDGLLFAHFFTKVYDHVLRPLMAPDRPNAPPELLAALDSLDRLAATHIANARVPAAA